MPLTPAYPFLAHGPTPSEIQVRLDILETGDLNVYVDQKGDAAPAAAYSFRSPVAGKIGCHAGQAKSFYLNFTVWGEAELPAEPEAE